MRPARESTLTFQVTFFKAVRIMIKKNKNKNTIYIYINICFIGNVILEGGCAQKNS